MTKRLRYIYHGHVQIAKIDAINENAPQVAKTYLWDPSESVATRILHINIWNNGEEMESLYYTHDLQKNVTALFGQAAGRRAQYEHDPYGNPINTTDDDDGLNPFRYSSEYHDEELDLIYYNPTGSRWINRDPIAEQGGRRLCLFVRDGDGWFGDVLGLEDDYRYIGPEEDSIIAEFHNFVDIKPKSPQDFIETTILAFVREDYPKGTTLLYSSDSVFSERLWKSPALRRFRHWFYKLDDFCNRCPGEFYMLKFHRFAYRVPTVEYGLTIFTLGLYRDGLGYGDMGIEILGSFSVEYSYIIDCKNCTKSIRLIIYNTISVQSATRDP